MRDSRERPLVTENSSLTYEKNKILRNPEKEQELEQALKYNR